MGGARTGGIRVDGKPARQIGHELTANDLRPEVLAFACAMEARLRSRDSRWNGNSWQRGFKSKARTYAADAKFKVDAAFKAFDAGDSPRALELAADAGNYAMIVADCADGLPLAKDIAAARKKR